VSRAKPCSSIFAAIAIALLLPQHAFSAREGAWDDKAGKFQAPIAEPDTAHSHLTLNGGDQLQDFLLADALFTGMLTKQLFNKETIIAKYSALLFAIDSCAAGGFIGNLAAKDGKESGLGNAANVRPGIGVMTAAAFNRCSVAGSKGNTATSAFSAGFNIAVGPPHPESDAWIGAYKTASKAIQTALESTGSTLAMQAPQYWSTGDAIDARTLKPNANNTVKDVAFLVVNPADKNSQETEQSFWNDLVKLHKILIDDYGWSDTKDAMHEIIVLFADGSKPNFVKEDINWIDGAATSTIFVNELSRVHDKFTDPSLGFFYFAAHGASTEPFFMPEPPAVALILIAGSLVFGIGRGRYRYRGFFRNSAFTQFVSLRSRR
jgi:hypothetical protein